MVYYAVATFLYLTAFITNAAVASSYYYTFFYGHMAAAAVSTGNISASMFIEQSLHDTFWFWMHISSGEILAGTFVKFCFKTPTDIGSVWETADLVHLSYSFVSKHLLRFQLHLHLRLHSLSTLIVSDKHLQSVTAQLVTLQHKKGRWHKFTFEINTRIYWVDKWNSKQWKPRNSV